MVPFLTLHAVAQRRADGAGGEDGDRHLDGDDPLHLAVERARASPARRGALGHRARHGAGHRGRRAARRRRRVRAGQGRSALALLFALFVGFSATQMLLRPQARRHAQHARAAGPAPRSAAGSASCPGWSAPAAPSSSVPFMTWCNVPIHNAVATSAALGFPIALANTRGLRHRRLVAAAGAAGCVRLPLPAGAGDHRAASVLMAPLGARVAHAMDVSQLEAGVRADCSTRWPPYMLYKALERA